MAAGREPQVGDIAAVPRRTSARPGPSPATPVSAPDAGLPVKLAVERHDGDIDSWELADLSLKGAFLHSGPARPQGAELELALWLRDADVSLEIPTRARVEWLNDNAHPREPNRPTGMAVVFCGMEDGDLQLLRAYLNRHPGSAPAQTGPPPPPSRTRVSDTSSAGPVRIAADRLLGAQIGAYRIVELVGSGGMADVYLAVHTQIGRQVALKKLDPSYTQDANIVRRFFDEARVVNQIHHPNIIEITDFIVQDDGYYYVMELLDGPSLEDLFRKQGPLPVERLLPIAVQLCDAIAAVHQAGVVHRDLKPANVMLIQHGDENDFVKLLDFGIAKLREPVTGKSLGVTIEGTALGTPGYMAPEQLLSNQTDERSDVYALGVILYRMITGRMPHAAETAFQMLVKQANEPARRPTAREAARVPRGLVDVTMACLHQDPAKRPRSATDLAMALRSLQAPADGSGPHEISLDDLVDPGSNDGWRWFATGVGIAALIAALGAWWLLRADVRDSAPARAVDTAAATAEEPGTASASDTVAHRDSPDGARAAPTGADGSDAAGAGPADDSDPGVEPEDGSDESSPRARRQRNRRSKRSLFDRAPRARDEAKNSSFFDQFSE